METSTHERDFLMWEYEMTIGDRVGVGYGAITAGELGDAEYEQLAEAVKECLVDVDPNAPCCCIDGRDCLFTLDGSQTSPRFSVAGGPVTAYAAAELVGWFDDFNGTTKERYAFLDAHLNGKGLPTGTHIDSKAKHADFAGDKTGCGADDRMLENAAHIAQDFVGVEGFVKALSGAQFDSEHMKFSGLSTFAERNADWNPKTVVDVISKRDPKGVEVLRSEPTPTGGHEEVAVVFNFVEGKTIDRDALVEKTGKQVFVVDMSYIDKLAKAMVNKEIPEDAALQYSQLKHAMIAYQIGTYLTLCDGSQRIMTLQQAA